MTWYLLDGRHVACLRRRNRRRRRGAHAPMIHAASHVDHKKELHGFLFLCMHHGALLGGPSPELRYDCENKNQWV